MNTLFIILIVISVGCIILAAYFYAHGATVSRLLDAKQGLLEETLKKLETNNSDLLESRLKCVQLETDNANLRKSRDEDEKRRETEFEQQLNLVKETLQTDMYKLLESKTKSLKESNSDSISSILKPYQESLKQMCDAVESARDLSNRNASTVGEMIKQMMVKTEAMTVSAENMIRVFRHESKTVGNWGETILETILENSGLTKGEHYHLQAMLKDEMDKAQKNESQKKMIPDAIIHYPDGRDMYVDSKVSLTAFMDYKNAQTDEERTAALQRHIESVKSHVREIEKADYVSYGNKSRRPLDCVIMFMPIDVSMQLALGGEPTLWNWAFEKKIFITSEQNLILALKMVRVAWVQQVQIQNQEKVYSIAGNLLDRIADFGKELDEVGQKIDSAKDQYSNAKNKLMSGQQSISVSARQLKELGANAKPSKQEKLNSVISLVSE